MQGQGSLVIRRIALPAMVIMLACLASCGGSTVRTYYTLAYPLVRDPATLTRPPLHPVRLRLRPFKVSLPYDRPQLVYRQSPFQFYYDPYRLWAAKPQHMVREMVQTHLESTRLFAEVSRDYGDQAPDYEMTAEILAIEEFDSGDTWYGHLAIRFELVRFKDRMPLWHHHFERKRKVFEKRPVFVVRAISQIMQEEMERIVAELDRVVSQDRGVSPTLRLPMPTSDDDAPSSIMPEQSTRPPTGRRTRGVRTPASTSERPTVDQELIVPEESGQ
jgi:uncharacterized lipoprotein YmbA